MWHDVAPLFEQIRAGGPAVYAEDAPFVLQRDRDRDADAAAPNAWFTFSLSAARDDKGAIIAFLNIASESNAPDPR